MIIFTFMVAVRSNLKYKRGGFYILQAGQRPLDFPPAPKAKQRTIKKIQLSEQLIGWIPHFGVCLEIHLCFFYFSFILILKFPKMTSSWNNLPIDILEMIFEVYKEEEGLQEDLLQCERVYKAWKVPAQRLAYSHLVLRPVLERLCRRFLVHYGINYQVDTWELAGKLIKTLERPDPSPWNNVKVLDCGDLWDFFTVETEVKYIQDCARLFPFVEELKATELGSHFYLDLIQLHKENKWTKLKSIPPHEEDEFIPVYMTCLLELSNSLSHVVLADRVKATYEELVLDLR